MAAIWPSGCVFLTCQQCEILLFSSNAGHFLKHVGHTAGFDSPFFISLATCFFTFSTLNLLDYSTWFFKGLEQTKIIKTVSFTLDSTGETPPESITSICENQWEQIGGKWELKSHCLKNYSTCFLQFKCFNSWLHFSHLYIGLVYLL